MISIPEAAAKLGLSRQWVHDLCVQRRIPGARRYGGAKGTWQVPDEPVVLPGGAVGRPRIKRPV